MSKVAKTTTNSPKKDLVVDLSAMHKSIKQKDPPPVSHVRQNSAKDALKK